MHDVDHRDLQGAGALQQLADLGQRRPDIGERQLAVGVFALRVDHHDGRLRQRRRRWVHAGHFKKRLGFHLFAIRLVSRFRSSQTLAVHSHANFGIEGH
jgi:hypothetical protein